MREISDQEFDSVIASEKVVVVDFWAPWCGPCKTLAPILEDLSTNFPNGVLFTKINCDDHQEKLQKYNIRGIPTVLIFKNGVMVTAIVGSQPREDYVEAITDAEDGN